MRRALVVLVLCLAALTAQAQMEIISPGGGGSGTAFTGGTVTTPITSPGYVAAETLGTELVTHTAAGWGLSSPVGAWSMAATTITRTASGANLTITNAAPTALVTYKVVWTLTRSAGTVTISVGGTSGTAQSASGTITEVITAAAATAVTITADATFAGTITAVSVKPYTDLVTSSAGPLIFKPGTSIRPIPGGTYGNPAFGSLRMASGTQVLVADGSAVLPSLALASEPTTGWYRNAPGQLAFSYGTSPVLRLANGVLSLKSDVVLGWSASDPTTVATDVNLARDAAGVLGLRNSTTAQELRVWGTTTLSKYLKLKHDGTNGIIDVPEATATTGATQAGMGLTINASDAVASTDTAGAAAGGSVTITAGDAKRNTSGNAAGGNITLTPGAGIGTGAAGYVKFPAGTEAQPSIAIGSGTTTGLYEATGGSPGIVSSGVAQSVWFSNQMRNASGLAFNWASGSAHSTSADTGLARSAAGVVKVTDGSTGIRGYLGGGAAVASATAMPLPTGNVFHVTGTTDITSITATNLQSGVVITLIFDGVLNFTDGSNLKLASTMATTADDTITLVYDGSSFFEIGRSVN